MRRTIVNFTTVRYHVKMKRIVDVLEFLDKKAPKANAESWDNVGLLVGEPESEIMGAIAGIELSSEMIEFAINKGANLIVTHHPIFFKGRKSLRFTNRENEATWVRQLVKNDISLISMHTNFDRAPNALHAFLFNKLGFLNCSPLEKFQNKNDAVDSNTGYGIQGSLKSSMPISDFIELVKSEFNLEGLRYSGDPNLKIKSAGFVSGSGMFLWNTARKLKLDLFITGDVKHHEALDAINAGFNVLDVGHFGAEKHFAYVMENWFSDSGVSVDSFIGRDPFTFY